MTEIGSVEDFPENKGRNVNIDGIDIAVFNIDGEFYGIHNLCPHKRLPLHKVGEDRYPERPGEEDLKAMKKGIIDSEKPSIRCPWHYLEFDLEDGYNEVRNMNIATYDVEVSDGKVYVDI